MGRGHRHYPARTGASSGLSVSTDPSAGTGPGLALRHARKTYRRHGAPEPLFGVKFGDLRPLAKRIGRDHDLAVRLW